MIGMYRNHPTLTQRPPTHAQFNRLQHCLSGLQNGHLTQYYDIQK